MNQQLNGAQRRRLFKNTMTCGISQQLFTLIQHNRGIDGHRWACDGCGFWKSLRECSLFAGRHLTIRQILILIYCWFCDMPQCQMACEADVACEADESSKVTIAVDWCNFMQEKCEIWIEAYSAEVCGIDTNGNATVVEIDETKYFHCKYHHGQWRQGHWVFGGIERESGRCFLVKVSDCRTNTAT